MSCNSCHVVYMFCILFIYRRLRLSPYIAIENYVTGFIAQFYFPEKYIFKNLSQGDHCPDISLMVCGTHAHVKCYSYHASTSAIVSGGGRNATVHDLKPK